MAFQARGFKNRPPLPYKDDIRAYSKEYAESLDARDPLRHFRDEFIIPSKADLKIKTLAVDESAFIFPPAIILSANLCPHSS